MEIPPKSIQKSREIEMENMKEQVRGMQNISPEEENTTAFLVIFEEITGKVLELWEVPVLRAKKLS